MNKYDITDGVKLEIIKLQIEKHRQQAYLIDLQIKVATVTNPSALQELRSAQDNEYQAIEILLTEAETFGAVNG